MYIHAVILIFLLCFVSLVFNAGVKQVKEKNYPFLKENMIKLHKITRRTIVVVNFSWRSAPADAHYCSIPNKIPDDVHCGQRRGLILCFNEIKTSVVVLCLTILTLGIIISISVGLHPTLFLLPSYITRKGDLSANSSTLFVALTPNPAENLIAKYGA